MAQQVIIQNTAKTNENNVVYNSGHFEAQRTVELVEKLQTMATLFVRIFIMCES